MYLLGEVEDWVLLYADEELLLHPDIYVSHYIPTMCCWEHLKRGGHNILGRCKRFTSPTCDIESHKGWKKKNFPGWAKTQGHRT